jgi:F-type H+-transporting ATPase subunit delta
MADKTTIARPYARAVFDLAQRQGALLDWFEMLGFGAAVVDYPDVARLVDDPRVGKGRVVDLLLAVGGDRFSPQAQNLIRLLGEKDRLALLPEIRQLYEAFRAEAEGTVEARVISAQPLRPEQERRIADVLRIRLKREVSLQCETDPSLLGGVIIHAGDLVIDGSAQGQLARLAATLNR